MATIQLNQLIQMITREVVAELQRQGVQVMGGPDVSQPKDNVLTTKSEQIDMSKFKSPVLTAAPLERLHPLTGEIVIPEGTIITPKAKQMIHTKNLKIRFE